VSGFPFSKLNREKFSQESTILLKFDWKGAVPILEWIRLLSVFLLTKWNHRDSKSLKFQLRHASMFQNETVRE